MPENDLAARLADHRTLASAPRAQLEWLAARGTLRRYAAGEIVAPAGEPLEVLNIVLSGHIAITVDRGAGPRRIMEWRAGDVTGILPFSRIATPPGHSVAEEPAEVLAVHREHFPALIAECPDLTAIFVHVMLDRARHFTTSDLHDEKMISLGRLAAGLAHELNNPASALARGASELRGRLFELEATALALGAVRLTAEQVALIGRIRARCDAPGARAAMTPLERSDREEALVGWLSRRGLRGTVAEMLVETALDLESLDALAAGFDAASLEFALCALGAGHRARTLTHELEVAASRIETLVAAVKGFTHMDQSHIPRPVALAQGLSDTIAVLGGKARKKPVTVTLEADADLPPVDGFGGELNQVWANLIDNAIDAAPPSGHVEVAARSRGGAVVVSVVDDGPGVPAEIAARIFDPFFTTKEPGQGTGLGLDIARRLVGRHGGRIEVDSRPGRTEFRVTIPESGHPSASQEDRHGEVPDRGSPSG